VNKALVRLEAIAADSSARDMQPDLRETLTHLQYDLHLGSEHVWGLTPPAGAELVHSALGVALADARDMTSRVASTLDEGDFNGFDRLQSEWSRTLRSAQTARRKLSARNSKRRPPELRDMTPQLVAVALVVSGGVLLSAVAVPLWPLWGAGLLAISSVVGLART
jgi:hypothetical protein